MIIRLKTWAERTARRESGVALIIVLMVIVAFALLVAGMTTSLEVETRLARNFTRDRTLEWHCYSGMELARYLLAQQIKVSNANKQFDALNQRWAGGPMGYDEPFSFINTTNTAFGDSPTNNTVLDLIYPPEDRVEWEEENEVMIEDSTLRCEVVIRDNERKYNINWAAKEREILLKACEMIGLADLLERLQVADSIMDWVDPNDDSRINGADGLVYSQNGIQVKNGPIDRIEELLMVEYIRQRPEMFWGNGYQVENGPGEPLVWEHGDGVEDDNSFPFGLRRLFTAMSSGRINVNTAPEEVLRLFLEGHGIDQLDAAARIVDYRDGDDNLDGTVDDKPFRQAGEIVGFLGLNQQGLSQFRGIASQRLSVRSSMFEVEVTAEEDGRQKTLVGLLYRDGQGTVTLLSVYWK